MNWILIIGIIAATLLMLVILVQNPKGGGLASNFSQGNQIFGVEKTTNVVEKITWGGALLARMLGHWHSHRNSHLGLSGRRIDVPKMYRSQRTRWFRQPPRLAMNEAGVAVDYTDDTE